MIKSKRINNKLVLGVLIWFLLLVLFTVVLFVIPGITGILNSSYAAEYDTLFASQNIRCYLVKEEKIVTADRAGATSYYVEDGSHVRTGSAVVKAGRTEYTADQPGIVSYSADGCEDYFTEDNIGRMTKDKVESLQISKHSIKQEQVEKGDPLYKVINDKFWYVVFWVSKDDAEAFNTGSTAELVLDSNSQVNTQIRGVYEQGDGYMIVLKTFDYYSNLAETRVADAEIVTANQTGLLVRESSIVTVDGKEGVYVKKVNGDCKFVRVKVLSNSGDKVIVASGTFYETVDGVTNQGDTINLYDEIIKNGKSVSEGGEDSE